MPIGENHLITAMGNICPMDERVIQKPGKHFRINEVIAIHKPDPLSCCLRNAPKPCRGNTTVFLVNGFYAWISCGIGIDDGSGGIGGSVVDNDDLQIFVGL